MDSVWSDAWNNGDSVYRSCGIELFVDRDEFDVQEFRNLAFTAVSMTDFILVL
jgi:phosphoglycerol transferase MdoB-like AlkP superfamily enzyme